MILTKETLDKLIREVIKEHKHIPFKSKYEAEQHQLKQQKEHEAERERKRQVVPGYENLLKLSKGILQEEELIDDEGDFVKIKRLALQRLLVENNTKVKAICNRNNYYQLDDILKFISKLNAAEKAKF